MEHQQNGNPFSSRTPPFEPSFSHTRNSTSFRHLNQILPPQTSLRNPYQETIESLFSRLTVSHHDQDGQLGSHHGGDIFRGPALEHRPFPVQEIGQNLHNDVYGLNSYTPVSSNIDFLDSFISPNVNGFSRHSDSRGFFNGSMSKTQNYIPSVLYNRSPHWLQEPSNYLPFEYLRGSIVRLAKDQQGCRLVQRALDTITKEEICSVFLEVIDFLDDLMVDPFGNYVVQKLVEVSSEEQRTQILLSLTKSDFQLVRICLNMHGTRAVQKLLERIASKQQVSMVMSALSPGAVELAKDMNGHHVIKHCLEHFSDEDNKYLLNVVADNCFEIATDKSGCCVLQQCVECSKGEPRDRLVAEIIANSLLLAEDRYGNYVVQHILGLRVSQVTAKLFRQLEGSFAALSCNKYGSNVVEKFLIESREEQSRQIICELLSSSNVSMLLVDPYGNYVIQSALSVSKGQILGALLELIQINIPRMRSNIYGKKLLAWLHRERLPYL